jgi:hypothetical protein
MKFHVRVQVSCVWSGQERAVHEIRKTQENKGLVKRRSKKNARIDIKLYIKYIHELISININQYQFVYKEVMN